MSSFLCDRIAVIETQIIAYEAAVTALLADGVQSYTLNTGQTQQAVTKFDLEKLQTTLDGLYNQYTVMQARCGLGGTVTAAPGW